MIEMRQVSMRYGAVQPLAAASLLLPTGSRAVLLGPSGCGKTTVLRLIAGLETPCSGEIALRGQIVTAPGLHMPPHARRLGFAFQSPCLWPHMTVAGNILYGLAGQPAAQSRQRLDMLLAGLGLEGLARRRPYELSGGQAKRVSLARSLAPAPDTLLLDEPTAFLDTATQRQVLAFILEWAASMRATVLLATHAPDGAENWADQVLTMGQGHIVAA